MHRARALPTIILPSSCGNIYPFSSSLRPRDSSRVQPFPSVFPRSLPPDLGCSARYRLKQSLLCLFPTFCLAKGLHNSLIAFLLLQWSDVRSSHGLLWYVCPRSSTLPLDHTADTGLAPFQTHCISSEICYQQPSHTATRGHSTFYFKKRCIMNFYYLIYRRSVPQIPSGRAMYSTRRHYRDSWSSHRPSTKLPFIWIRDVGRPHPR